MQFKRCLICEFEAGEFFLRWERMECAESGGCVRHVGLCGMWREHIAPCLLLMEGIVYVYSKVMLPWEVYLAVQAFESR
jgi:hypothetical protein